MANNRLYIRCMQCGETVAIAKHFAGALYTYETIEEDLDAFFEKHNYCSNRHYHLELCEEFPGEMTDSIIDETGKIWYDNWYDEIEEKNKTCY